jgi:hypothetical protein
MSVDQMYVTFVAAAYPNLSFRDLGNYILQHYEYILKITPGYQQRWWSHLAQQIGEVTTQHASIVVEGYQLHDCKDLITRALEQNGHTVFQIRAESFRYTIGQQSLTPEAIAGLGTEALTAMLHTPPPPAEKKATKKRAKKGTRR